MDNAHPLGPEEIDAYRRDGYVYLPGFFSPRELAPACEAIARDPSIGGRIEHVHDGISETKQDRDNGYRLDYIGWFREGDDWLGTCTRLQRIVEGAAALIGEPVYHYHSKLVRKPREGSGTLIWHQDYGGWYQDGCIRPDMLTCVIALTDCDGRERLSALPEGFTRAGPPRSSPRRACVREHQPATTGREFSIVFEEVPAIMHRGDGLFFHGNLVHSSGPNRADHDRWLLELSYNGMSNEPVFEDQGHHAAIPLEVAPDDSLRIGAFDGVFGRTPIQDLSDHGAEGASIYYRDEFPLLS